MFRRIENKSNIQIENEWDGLAQVRYHQIMTGEDLTFQHIIAPIIIDLASKEDCNLVVDAGCGVGILTDLLAEKLKCSVVGVDLSGESVHIARSHFGSHASFIHSPFESYAKSNPEKADVVVANMVLMDVLDLNRFLKSVYDISHQNSALIFSITHPWFWPEYYGYSKEPWFHYDEEMIIEGPFRISSQPNCHLVSTHIHRPLANYFEAFLKAGFAIELLHEPMPPPEINARYPKPWHYPRYLLGRCRRRNFCK